MTQEQIRKEISKILISWSMPSRQPAINQIMQLLAKHDEELYFNLEGALQKEYKDFDNTMDASSAYAHAIAIAKQVFGIKNSKGNL